MSRVIKNNDGVAVVEGTPAASLVKDVNKFFATKPPKRMAGESIGRTRKIDPRAINIRRPTPKDLKQMNNPPIEKQAEVSARREKMMEDRTARDTVNRDLEDSPMRRTPPRRNEARDKAESRRIRFFNRRRSRKEAERSQTEQEATQGKFITKLGR